MLALKYELRSALDVSRSNRGTEMPDEAIQLDTVRLEDGIDEKVVKGLTALRHDV